MFWCIESGGEKLKRLVDLIVIEKCVKTQRGEEKRSVFLTKRSFVKKIILEGRRVDGSPSAVGIWRNRIEYYSSLENNYILIDFPFLISS